MNTRKWLIASGVTILVFLAILALAAGLTRAQEPEPPEGEGDRQGAEAAGVSGRIPVQGRLTDAGGNPLDGVYVIRFSLYDASTGGNELCSDIRAVSVENGLFHTYIEGNCNTYDISGQQIYLGVQVGSDPEMTPRQGIYPVPYAFSLRPGAIISDTRDGILTVRSTGSGDGDALFAYADGEGEAVTAISVNGVGVYAASDSDTAVRAETTSGFAAVDGRNSIGYGVYGHSISSHGIYGRSGYFHGVYGRSDSASNAGVYAQGTGFGPDIILDGDSTSDDGRIYSDPTYSSSDIILVTNDAVRIDLDNDGGGEDADFEIYDMNDTRIFNVDDSGTTSIRGNLVIQSSSTGDTIIELGEGLDYAEGFDVSDEAEITPGTVLVIDPDHPGELMVSNMAYDRKVAGIVAGAGGLGSAVRLGSDRFDYDVALAGRVYCNVDATEEGIEPGDLLTTSATPGHAMKVTDYERAQGAILGKAMEGLEKGKKGQILVLVTLQ